MAIFNSYVSLPEGNGGSLEFETKKSISCQVNVKRFEPCKEVYELRPQFSAVVAALGSSLGEANGFWGVWPNLEKHSGITDTF